MHETFNFGKKECYLQGEQVVYTYLFIIMSRSKRKPIFKEKSSARDTYWKTVRRVQKQFFKQDKDVPSQKTIVNDYDYCDYRYDMRDSRNEELKKKYSRK